MFWERERASSDLFIGLLDFLRFERGSAIKHSVKDDTDRPMIDLIAVASVGLEDLRSQVIWRSTYSTFLLTLIKNLRSEAKVSHLELHFVRQEQITKL